LAENLRVFITGAAGYIGRMLVDRLLQQDYVSLVVATDIKELATNPSHPKLVFAKVDIRSPLIGELMRQHRVNTVVHLATIVTPDKGISREMEYDVDVVGTRNVLQGCVEAGVRQLIVTSSGAVYGYYPNSPEWLSETDPLRGNEEFAYAYHKRLVEEMLAEFRRQQPQLKQLIFRPGTILGRNTRNQITALFHKKVVLGIVGSAAPFVFIWDEDVVNCIEKGIREGAEGIYNLAGDGVVTMREIAELVGKPYLPLPAWLAKTGLWVLGKLGLSRYGPEQVNFLRYRPVLSNRKLKEEFGYLPRKTSREVFEYYLSYNQ